MRTLVFAAAASAALALGGCAEPHAAPPAPNVKQRALGEGAAPVIGVRKITNERGDRVYGYLKAMEGKGDRTTNYKPVQTFWVYDTKWNKKGFYTLHGLTYRLVRDPITGEEGFESIGEHDVDDSKLILLG
ncbi:MAG TPA: hypothetical protein VHF22_03225, partial [Planctomycetota bacterium]|nr:hypothetical protein [Planctomycetota bacterium]